MKPTTKGKLDEAITKSLRDVADTDYIAARICWQLQLDHQFFWMALQAVEKYLKGILLFHRKSAKGLSHDICKALDRVKSDAGFDLGLDSETEQFIKDLNSKGPNRYFEWNLNRNGYELLLLDKTVWNLRIYCVALDSDAALLENGRPKIIWTSKDHFEKIKRYQSIGDSKKLPIPFGMLETILKSKSQTRTALGWNNFYFTPKRKKAIKWKARAHYSSPHHVIAPEIFSELEKLVDFSRETKEYFHSTAKKSSPKMPPAFFQLADRSNTRLAREPRPVD